MILLSYSLSVYYTVTGHYKILNAILQVLFMIYLELHHQYQLKYMAVLQTLAMPICALLCFSCYMLQHQCQTLYHCAAQLLAITRN